MKMWDTIDRGFLKKSAMAGLLLVIVAAVTLEATSLIQFYFSQKGIREEASLRAGSELEATKLKIDLVIDQTEVAVRNSVWLAQWALDVPDSLWAVSRRIVSENPVIVGSTIALVPGFDKRRPLFSPYCFMPAGTDSLTVSSLATPEYDYPSQEWFVKPIELDAGYWSEPYVDEGGGNILMTTYSVPLHAADGRTAGVLTADISLDWLTELVKSVQVYPNSYSKMLSRSGKIMVSSAESEADDKGHIHTFSAPVERTGWTMSIMIPDADIYGSIRKINLLVKILQLLGIVMLVLILRAFVRNLMKFRQMNQQKERIEGELQIARDIQMAMVPKIFPPFPERNDIDMWAAIVPAKEVGGDLYDFYIRDEKLYFCIGDVSGKGVPASLVMAVTRSLFRTVSAHEKSPQRIVTAMNDSMSETNENNMFVTFFCGILDLATGHMRYCNAGHNAPMMLTDDIRPLPVEPNLPLGVMPGMKFREQETDLRYDDAIFLYTDGLTEAENADRELFGEKRMMDCLRGFKPSELHLKNIEEAVEAFVGDAPRSDDLTMLFIHYLNEAEPQEQERHLILHNDIRQIPQLAEFVEQISAEKKLDKSLAMGLNLALEEAVSNVMLYAYPEESDGLVDIEAVIHAKKLEFIVSDNGRPFDPTAAPETDINLGVEERPIGGLGIHLVRNIMDEVSYERTDGKNILRMVKAI